MVVVVGGGEILDKKGNCLFWMQQQQRQQQLISARVQMWSHEYACQHVNASHSYGNAPIRCFFHPPPLGSRPHFRRGDNVRGLSVCVSLRRGFRRVLFGVKKDGLDKSC